MSTHLAAIKTRNVRVRSRDLLFAAFVALAAAVSIATLTTAVDVASVASR